MGEHVQLGADLVLEWLRRHAVPILGLQPGRGSTELEGLRALIGDAQFVGLGESAHGVHEFFTLKHRLCEWLVEELGFTAIALESSFSACQRINDYVLNGHGEPGEALTGQGYLAWDCEEFLDLLRWLRRHNQNVPAGRKVAFYGVDTGFNEIGRRTVLDYLRRFAPDLVDRARTAFEELAELESRWPLRLGDADRPAKAEVHSVLRMIDGYLSERQQRLTAPSSAAELDRVRQFVNVMLQWTESGADSGRHQMGHNLIGIIERERPGLKVVVWQANAHIGRGFQFSAHPTLGDLMHDRYGTAYRAIGLEFGQGTYLTRAATPDGYAADLVPTVMVEPPAGSLPWRLGRVGLDAFALDLRAADDPSITEWLSTPQLEHGGMWIYIDPTTAYHDATIGLHFDGLIFVADITPSRPTENARRTAATRTGL